MASRVDELGRACKRSQLQIQIAVNRYRDELETKLLAALPTLAALDPVFDWRSPREDDRFREYYDGSLLDRIGRSELRPKLKQFWPAGGPHWDAIAVAGTETGDWLGPVLIEAKSYPKEQESSCAAKDPASRELIERRLTETRAWLGVADDHAHTWMNGRYQSANRLTFLRFFRQVLGEQAWLVNVYVVDDPDPTITTTHDQWQAALAETTKLLGISEHGVEHSGAVFIPGRERHELTG